MRNCWHRRDRKKSIGKGDRTGREMFGESAAGGRGYKYIQRADRDKQTRICMQPLGERRLLVPALLPGIGVFFFWVRRRGGRGREQTGCAVLIHARDTLILGRSAQITPPAQFLYRRRPLKPRHPPARSSRCFLFSVAGVLIATSHSSTHLAMGIPFPSRSSSSRSQSL